MPIYTGEDLGADTTLDADVCVVGSGAGGAHVAARLAEAGKRVIVLEDGGFHLSSSFDMREAHMVPRLYQEGGGRATDNGSIAILQGRAVGGTTVVNWTTCFRTPKQVVDHWHEHHAVTGFSREALVPHWERVEQRLHVTQMQLAQVNANNRVLWDGAEALGWSKQLLSRNVTHCAHSGYCGMGCPIDAKQSMLVTLIPDAVRAGADVYANCWVQKVSTQGRRAHEVVALVRDPKTDRMSGRTLKVHAKIVVLSGGAINTPALLLRSELDKNGRTGKRTFLHPVPAVSALHSERIEPFHGSPQYVGCDQFAFGRRPKDKMSYLLESAPGFPVGTASAGFAFGAELQTGLEALPFTSVQIALCHDGFDLSDPDEGGTVTLRPDGSPKLAYKWTPRLQEALCHATKSMARVAFKAGAKTVSTLHVTPPVLHSEADIAKLDSLAYGELDLQVFSAHVMGGCPMGKDPKRSVVDSATLRHHELDNLFVIDGSVYPTSLSVNPQLSIYGLASWASEHVKQAV